MSKKWEELTKEEKKTGCITIAGIVLVLAFIGIICGDDSDEVVESNKESKEVTEVKSVKVKVPEPENQNVPSILTDPSLYSGLEIEYKDIIGRWNTSDDNSGGFTFTDDFKVYIHAYNNDKKAWINTKIPGSYTLNKDILTIVLYGDKTELEVIRFNQNKIILMNWATHSLFEPVTYPTSFIHWNRRNLPFE